MLAYVSIFIHLCMSNYADTTLCQHVCLYVFCLLYGINNILWLFHGPSNACKICVLGVTFPLDQPWTDSGWCLQWPG